MFSNDNDNGQDYQAPVRGANLPLDLLIIQNATNGFRNQINDSNNKLKSIEQENEELKEQLGKNGQTSNRRSGSYNLGLLSENKKLTQDLDYYVKLLAQPMQTIAEHNKDFKNTYEQQQTMLADWMVSQKAFKELAIDFGKKLGLSFEEVIEMGKDKKLDVLEDRNDPSHNTNASDDQFIVDIKETLVDKAQKAKAARKAKILDSIDSLRNNHNNNKHKP